ncbi:hypothetical protein MLD38_025204 [Melastoma candidum]|uniref:Uncharacterized protein n=1 Tax=Melastoma candidum TaxID=119954 RepID=A0ACB9NY58_9MYRT|nr:hypothetical protein MLD38_025204 [Melastoma candidum]
MDSGLTSPLSSSSGLLTTDDDDHDHYLHELTRQMAYHTLLEQDDDDKGPVSVSGDCTFQGRDKRADQTRRWVDLFSVPSPQSTPWSPSGLSRCGTVPLRLVSPSETSSSEQDIAWDTPLAPELLDKETWSKTGPVQNELSPDQNPRNHDHELRHSFSRAISKDTGGSYFLPEKPPKQAEPASRKPHANNDKQRTRSSLLHGESYISLSLPPPLPLQQNCYPPHTSGSGTRTVFPNSRTGSTGTGVFLPRTGGNPRERPWRKPRRSTVLIPARVAQALMVHFSETSPQLLPSVVGDGGGRSFNSRPGDDALENVAPTAEGPGSNS